MEKTTYLFSLRSLMLVLGAVLFVGSAPVSEAAIASRETPERVEMMFWSAVQNSTNPEEFEAYVDEFPEGKFVRLAKVRAKALRRTGSVDKLNAESALELPKVLPSAPAAVNEAVISSVEKPPLIDDLPLPDKNSTTQSAAARESAGIKTVAVEEPKSAAALPSAEIVQGLSDCTDCPELVGLSAGQFMMGSTNAQDRAGPPHSVDLDYPFYMSRYEVTAAQWNYCVDQGGCTENEGNRNNGSSQSPATSISWQDAQDYVQWLSSHTGNDYRLPTEAEWEYAARAGSSSAYWWGDKPEDALANCRECGGDWNSKLPAKVDEFPANAFGLFAISGGVSEWAQDCWVSSYDGVPADGSSYDEKDCTVRVLRGGSWKNDADFLGSATRIKFDGDVRYLTNGFRVVRVIR